MVQDSLESNKSGRIFDLQRYSTHDGPGIRTVVFMKGCPLRCRWCSNPESQEMRDDIFFRKNKCIGCGKCAEVCPVSIQVGLHGTKSTCIRCGKCTEVCPSGALEMMGAALSVEATINEISRDESYYEKSGGGITISGGEPLMQADRVAELAIAAHGCGYHVAVETSGYADWDSAKKVFDHADLILYDVKHTDTGIHKAYTNVPNGLIIDNLRRAASEGYDITVRIPLIDGFNATIDNITATVKLMKEMDLGRVDLLPYHTYGENKYMMLGKDYDFDSKRPTDDILERYMSMFREEGISVSVGG